MGKYKQDSECIRIVSILKKIFGKHFKVFQKFANLLVNIWSYSYITNEYVYFDVIMYVCMYVYFISEIFVCKCIRFSVFVFIKDMLTTFLLIRDCTLSMEEGGRRVFVGVMKYFRHILMGHENFSKCLMGHEIFSYVLFS